MTGGVVLETKYRRVVLKLSGEALAGDQGFGINPQVVEAIAAQIKKVRDHGIAEGISGADLQAVRRGWIARRQTIWG